MDLYGMRVESPKGVKNAEMGHKEIENSRRMDSYTIETTHWGDDWVAKRTRRLRPVSRKVGTGKTSGGKKRWICKE
ncbi:hypothetical protein AXX17_AT5G34280 [Arabidopsis thaliana]|uniref:Uncharacterized protein n=1 Tax=Arabidopsis thaliana TaxID=3702 RepID=A0A178UAI5_ARATH|nr:hypothetical protein AXX17_AT5G34280 [Arabidopsis thaliana]